MNVISFAKMFDQCQLVLAELWWFAVISKRHNQSPENPNIFCQQLLKYVDLLLFAVLHYNEVKIFGSWTVVQTKQTTLWHLIDQTINWLVEKIICNKSNWFCSSNSNTFLSSRQQELMPFFYSKFVIFSIFSWACLGFKLIKWFGLWWRCAFCYGFA